MIRRFRQWRRFRHALVHENPRRLSPREYRAALVAQEKALAAVEREQRVPWPHELIERRRAALRHWAAHQGFVSKDQMAAFLERQLRRGMRP